MSTVATVDGEIERVEREGGVISVEAATIIASWWHGPGARDEQMTRLSHGTGVTDWEELRDLVAWHVEQYPAHKELSYLLAWVKATAQCEQCHEGNPALRGILLGANTRVSVEACDQCDRYDGDIAAGMAVAKLVRGGVVFWQNDVELAAEVEARIAAGTLDYDYDPAEVGFELRRYWHDEAPKPDDCLRFGEYPWIEIAGCAIDWTTFRVVFAALGGAV